MASAFSSNTKKRKLDNSVKGASSSRHIADGVSSFFTRVLPRISPNPKIPLVPLPLSQSPSSQEDSEDPEPEPEPNVEPTKEARYTQVRHLILSFHSVQVPDVS